MIWELDRISLLAQYEQPETHKHYAKHFLLSPEPFTAVIEATPITANSIFIQSNISHEIRYEAGSLLLVMLIDESSTLSDVIDGKFLKGRPYVCGTAALEEALLPCLGRRDLRETDRAAVREILGEEKSDRQTDPAIARALEYVRNLDTIGEDCFARMAGEACLSRSRFSHLFKETMHIDCKNYLLQKKFEKAFLLLFDGGYSITDAAMMAGFSSSSHIATAFKNHFGISITRLIREQNLRL